MPSLCKFILPTLLFAAVAPVGAARAETLMLTYAYDGGGLKGHESANVDTAHGWYAATTDLGPLHVGEGFDGETPWMLDHSGAVTPELGGDRLPLAINEAWRNTQAWRRRDLGGARLDDLGPDGGLRHLRLTPPGGAAFEAWIEPSTGDLRRIAEQRGFHRVTIAYDDYQATAGERLAGRITSDIGAGPDGVERLRLETVRAGGARAQASYGRAPGAPRDWSLPASGGVTVPFRLLNNHIFIDAMVNGRGPFAFILDTGGHNILTPATVAALGLASKGQVATGGAGAKSVSGGYVQVDRIDVGGLSLGPQTALDLEFSALPVEGLQEGGMLGFEVFRRFVVQIDYGASRVTFIDPQRFRPDGVALGARVPFVFYDHMPQVRGRFAGLPVRFNLDTGARNEVTLTRPFVTRAHLAARFRGARAIDGWGVGGPTLSDVVRAPSLSLGPVEIAHPVAGLSAQAQGSMSDPHYEGNIGSGLLKRFVVTFDYAHQSVYLRRLKPTPNDVGTFDRLGAWINLADTGFQITAVTPKSAAAAAGLRQGDVITAIDGRPSGDFSLSDARRRFRSDQDPAGVRLTVASQGATREVRVRLRDQIPRT